MPAPMPIRAPSTISSTNDRESIEPMPQIRNIAVPSTNILILLPFTECLPAISIKGIIISEGNDSNISTSNRPAEGNIVSNLSRIGDTANPGNDTIADTDHIATNATRGIVPFPVFTFIKKLLFS